MSPLSLPKKGKSHKRQPRYLNIRTKNHLAKRLGIKLEILEGFAQYADLHYNPTRRKEKKDRTSVREIDAPKPKLKRIQRQIHVRLLSPLWLPESIHGYRTGHSIVTAAAPHAGRLFWWKADIRKFYPSISAHKVYRMFRQLGCSPDVARLLTRLTTRNYHLPQGTPTSPALANLYLRLSGIAHRLDGLAREHKLNLTFFGDDVIVSSDRPFMDLQKHLRQIITSSGLRLHSAKTGHVIGPDEKHEALGIVSNAEGKQLDVTRSYRQHLRTLLYLCRRYGPGSLRARGITEKDPRNFLAGKISFAAQVNPRHARLFHELDRIKWTRGVADPARRA